MILVFLLTHQYLVEYPGCFQTVDLEYDNREDTTPEAF